MKELTDTLVSEEKEEENIATQAKSQEDQEEDTIQVDQQEETQQSHTSRNEEILSELILVDEEIIFVEGQEEKDKEIQRYNAELEKELEAYVPQSEQGTPDAISINVFGEEDIETNSEESEDEVIDA